MFPSHAHPTAIIIWTQSFLNVCLTLTLCRTDNTPLSLKQLGPLACFSLALQSLHLCVASNTRKTDKPTNCSWENNLSIFMKHFSDSSRVRWGGGLSSQHATTYFFKLILLPNANSHLIMVMSLNWNLFLIYFKFWVHTTRLTVLFFFERLLEF